MTHLERKLNTLKNKGIDIKNIGCSYEELIEYLKENRVKPNLVNLLLYETDKFNLKERMEKIISLGNDSSSLNSFIIRYGEEEGNSRFLLKGKSCSLTREQYIEKFGIEKFLLDRGSNNNINREKKYGKEIAEEKREEYLKKWRHSHTESGYIEKYGEELGKIKYGNKKSRYLLTNSLDGYIEKYGEELGKVKFLNKNEKISYKNSLGYYIEKYGEIEGRRLIKEVKDTSSLDSYIKKYGELEGPIKYEKKCKLLRDIAISNSSYLYFGQNNYTSKIANSFFEKIIEKIDHNQKIYCFDNEFKIYSAIQKRIFCYDFKVSNKIIEFNGDYWHANPKHFKSSDLHKTLKIPCNLIWEADDFKIKLAESKGNEILVVWESEYKEDPDHIINKCLNFLKL